MKRSKAHYLILDSKLFCRKNYRGSMDKDKNLIKKRDFSKAGQFIVKLPNPIADFLRLESPAFCSESIVFLIKIETEKKYLFKKMLDKCIEK